MNVNNTNHYYEAPNNQYNLQASVQQRQSYTGNINIADREIANKVVETSNLVGIFSANVLDKLIDNNFFLEDSGSWRNKEYYVFKNQQTGKNITADADRSGAGDLNTQALAELLKIKSLEARVNRLSGLNEQHNLNAFTDDLNFWVSKEKTVDTLSKTSINLASIDRLIAENFYLADVDYGYRNTVDYIFKSRNNNQTFRISTDCRDTLTDQLNTELAKIHPNRRFNIPATTSIPERINTPLTSTTVRVNTSPEEQIKLYAYKIMALLNKKNL